MRLSRHLISPFVFVLGLVLAGCDDSSRDRDDVAARRRIGSTGGAVVVTEGPLAGTAVEVPPGALTEAIAVTIAEGPDIAPGASAVIVGPAAECGPGGAAFALPVTVTVRFDAARIPAGATAADVFILRRDDESGAVTSLPPVAIDAANGLVSAETTGFSTFQAAAHHPEPVDVVDARANAFAAFSTTPFDSIVDLRFVDRDRLLASEISGRVYVFDVGPTGSLALARTVSVTAAPLSFPRTVNQLATAGRNAAYLSGPGDGHEVVYLFDPETASAPTASLTVRGNVLFAGGMRLTTARVPAGDFEPRQMAGVATVGSKLYLAFSNPDNYVGAQSFNPGAVLVYDLDPADPLAVVPFGGAPRDVVVSGGTAPRAAIFTSGYNPTTMTTFTTEGGTEVLLVVNSGAISQIGTGTDEGSIDVIDPATDTLVATIPLPGVNPFGIAAKTTATGARLAIAGSSTEAVVSIVDLRGLDDFLGRTEPASLPERAIAVELPIPTVNGPSLDFVPDVAFSADGRRAFVVNSNDSVVTVLEMIAQPAVVGQFSVPGRVGFAPFYESQTSFVEVRPGAPGTDYTGPDLFTAAIFIEEGDETPPNTGDNDNALDTFETAPR